MNPVTCFAPVWRLQVSGINLLVLFYVLVSPSTAAAASLEEALDNPALVWRTSAQAAWFAQNTQTHDGIDAAQSAAILDDQDSWIEVTLVGPAPVSFWWKVSSELGYDQLQFSIDGVEQINISGETSWEMRAFDVPTGTHVFRWRYAKDSSESAGLDRAWLDQVSYTPPVQFAPVISEQPASRTVAAGATVTFSIVAFALPEPSYQWFHNGLPVTAATNSILTLNNVAVADAGAYMVEVRNPLGFTNSRSATLTVALVGNVVEATNLNWTIGGDGAWFGQNGVTHDGVDALESGSIVNLQESWVETTITGPGVLTFWWKASSEPFYDGLQFLTNNVVTASLSGEAAWEQRAITFPRGTFTLRWRYFKDSSITIGQDKGWLDEVSYIPNKAPTNLVVVLSRQAIIENDSVNLSALFADPDVSDAHTLLVNWRDGSSITTNLPPGVYSFSTAHQYKDDDPSGSSFDNYEITVSVSDEAGTVSGTYPLTVSNAPPLLSGLVLSSPIFPYDTATLSGTISDISALDTLRLRVTWGDSTNVESFNYPSGATSFLLRHRYSIANSNAQVTLIATDDDLGALIVRTNVFVRPIPIQPRVLSVQKGTTGSCLVKLQGSAFANYQIQSSIDLVHWTTIAIRAANTNGRFEVDDPVAFTFQYRFYRAIWESQSAGLRFSAIRKLTNGQVTLQLIGLPGASYGIDVSTNFVNWTPAAAATMDSNGFFNFTDSAPTQRRKFYRATVP